MERGGGGEKKRGGVLLPRSGYDYLESNRGVERGSRAHLSRRTASASRLIRSVYRMRCFGFWWPIEGGVCGRPGGDPRGGDPALSLEGGDAAGGLPPLPPLPPLAPAPRDRRISATSRCADAS